MKTKSKIMITCAFCIIALIWGIAAGSVYLPPGNILRIIGNKLFGLPLGDVSAISVSILWKLRFPRTLLALLVGAALSASGAVMQSVLKNPLASSFTLGVSSGSSLGAGLVILLGITLSPLQLFTLPVFGFVFGLGTIFIVVGIASKLDGQMENNTIILIGMVFSLFTNAVTTLISAIAKDNIQRLLYWQMGSFSMKGWTVVFILAPIILIGIIVIFCFNREMDMMTFGEEQARTMGVELKKVKWLLLVTSAALTGCAIAFVGIIGFVDLIAPHAIRRIFGSSHRYLVPMSAVAGGLFMVLCDLAARTVVPTQELPVGVVTAIIGAPFFAYIYFNKRAKTI